MRCLRRVDDHEVFAHARGGRFFYRAADGELWACETAYYRASARSGTPLAYRVGTVYHDADRHVPMYYEKFENEPASV